MKKKVKFPYDYRTVPLKNIKGSATFIGEPSPELLEAVNKVADIAFTKIKNKNNESKAN